MAAPNFKPPPFRGTGKGPSAAPEPSAKANPRAKGSRWRPRAVHSEDESDGNWLVSYADMMTLLVGFFVMLSAFSVPDASKMEALKRETAESMGGKYTKPFEQLSNSIQQTLSEIKLDKEISVAETDDGVTIVSKGTLFFDSGSSELKPEAATLMNKIGEVLAKQAGNFRIFVEGHTDDSPIATKEFPSNWELSSIRAGSVVRLLESKGIARKNLRPLGLADTEPVSPNRDGNGTPIPANQAENRRIVIRVQKQLPKRMGENKAPASNGPAKAAPSAATAPQAPAAAAPEAPAPLQSAPVSAPTAPDSVPEAKPN